jgi:hypothetical protein
MFLCHVDLSYHVLYIFLFIFALFVHIFHINVFSFSSVACTVICLLSLCCVCPQCGHQYLHGVMSVIGHADDSENE